MSQADVDHFRRRALEERAHAASAGDAHVAKAHAELAEKYDAVAAAYAELTKRT
jgi:hypothetical protein